jgi:chromosomal replication initiation ATPase DnaA
VAEVFGIKLEELFVRSRAIRYSHPRFVLWSILWQPYGHRSLRWLCDRYGYRHYGVLHALDQVEKSTALKAKQITIMELLVTQLEVEMFGSRRPDFHANSPV